MLVDSHLMILDGDSSIEIEGIEEDTTEKSWLIDDELLKIATFFSSGHRYLTNQYV